MHSSVNKVVANELVWQIEIRLAFNLHLHTYSVEGGSEASCVARIRISIVL